MSSVRTPVCFLIDVADAMNSCLQTPGNGMSYAPESASALLEVVRGEHRVVGDLGEPARAVRAQIGVRAHEDAGAADERAHPPDRRRPLPYPLEPERAVRLAQHPRRGQERHQLLANRRPARRPGRRRRAASRTSCAC